MTDTKIEIKAHATDVELADLLAGSLSSGDKKRVEDHIALCGECLEKAVSAYESVKQFQKKGKAKFMKKINMYLVGAIVAFVLSFAFSRYFIQFLVATLLLGIKWIVDAKSTRMLIMIYEAWKKGGEKEASRILETLDSQPKNRI